MFRKVLAIFFVLLFSFSAKAQEEHTNILFVLDASFSMRKQWETKSKWTIAKETLIDVADSLKARLGDKVSFGIRAYGHQSMPVKNDCFDSDLILPIADNSIQSIKDILMSISPKGITPLAFSLEETKKDFAGFKGKNMLILITDGAESCEGDPCYIMKILMDNHVILKPFIIGLNIPIESLEAYDCIGGTVYNEASQKDFKNNLQKSIDRALTYTSLQVNLLDENNIAGQTNKAMFFYSKKDHKLKHVFYHKMNNGVSDTLYIEPGTYSVEVQSIPKVISEYFTLNAAKHNVVNVKVPTGKLEFVFVDENNKKAIVKKPPKYLIREKGKKSYIHQEFIGGNQEYIVGNYAVDLLTLPPIQMQIEIKNNQQHKINIPAPGTLRIRSKFPIHGAVFVKNVDSLINIYSLKPNTTSELLDLQPGNYDLVFRYAKEREMIRTKTISFTIKSKQITKIDL